MFLFQSDMRKQHAFYQPTALKIAESEGDSQPVSADSAQAGWVPPAARHWMWLPSAASKSHTAGMHIPDSPSLPMLTLPLAAAVLFEQPSRGFRAKQNYYCSRPSFCSAGLNLLVLVKTLKFSTPDIILTP